MEFAPVLVFPGQGNFLGPSTNGQEISTQETMPQTPNI
jgi:hypothetical protein